MSYALAMPAYGFGFPAPRRRGLGIAASEVQSTIAGAATAGADLATGNVIGAINAGIQTAATLLTGVIEGCGSTCEVTSEWANDVEAGLQQNIQAYFDIPAPRSTVDQTAAVDNFVNAWNALVTECGQASLGQAGTDCIQDREAGACHWHQTTTPPWGTPVQGSCWNWWNGYHDPIANDPNVYTPSAASGATSAVSDLTSSLGSNWLIPAAAATLLILALVVK